MKRFVSYTLALLLLAGCSSAYYGAMERFGVHKRDILADRVDEARDSQEDAQEEFRTALERLNEMFDINGGELEAQYNQLNRNYESSLAAANRVRDRVESVDDVANDLFAEWEDELERYSSDSLRRQSEQALRETQRRYSTMIASMERAADSMDPVLERFEDNVLFLKHNLNASAVAAIRGEYDQLQLDITNLIAEMERAIAESDRFIAQLRDSA